MTATENGLSAAAGAGAEAAADLVVLSVSFRDHSTADRDRLGATLGALGPFRERVLVETCHRTELVATSDDVPAPHGARVFRGREAIERVFAVAGGLDSAILAEEQVLGQVRDALTTALARRESGPLLNELFRRAIRFGKRVRSLAQPSADRSLAGHAARWALERVGTADRGRSALVIGTGETGRLLASELAAAGLRCTVASGSAVRAEDVVGALPPVANGRHRAADVADIGSLVSSHAIVAVAVRRADPVLRLEHVAAADAYVIDLSAPAAVAPDAAELLGARLLNLDRLGDPRAASPLSPRAQRQVREALAAEVDRYLAWLADRRNGTAGALHREAEALRARHVERLRARTALTEAQLDAVERMSAALVADVVHLRATEVRDELLSGSRS